MGAAWKVGGLVLLFGAMLLGAASVLRTSVFRPETVEYVVYFEDAGGLSSGAQVLMAGVAVGNVSEVGLDGNRARVVLSLEEPHRIPEGSEVVLPASFISIGDRQVEIRPPAQTTTMLEPGAELVGTEESMLASLTPDADGTLDELNNTLVAVQDLLGDEELKASVTGLMDSGAATADEFGSLARGINRTIAQTQPRIDDLLATTAMSLQNLEAVSVQVRELAESGELEGKSMELLDNLNLAVVEGRALVTELSSFATDPELRQSIRTMAANVETMTDSGVEIAENAEAISENGIVLSEQAAELLTKANDLADEVETLLLDLRDAVRRFEVGGGVGGLLPEVEVEANLTRETDPGRFRTDVGLIVPVGDERVHFGLWDAFESNKLNLQLSRSLRDDMDLRYGVYASRLGFGVDYAVAPRLGLRADLFGLNDSRLDLRARYDLGSGVYGTLGFERIFDDNAIALGVTVRR